jgi:hypothetical protein
MPSDYRVRKQGNQGIQIVESAFGLAFHRFENARHLVGIGSIAPIDTHYVIFHILLASIFFQQILSGWSYVAWSKKCYKAGLTIDLQISTDAESPRQAAFQ